MKRHRKVELLAGINTETKEHDLPLKVYHVSLYQKAKTVHNQIN